MDLVDLTAYTYGSQGFDTDVAMSEGAAVDSGHSLLYDVDDLYGETVTYFPVGSHNRLAQFQSMTSCSYGQAALNYGLWSKDNLERMRADISDEDVDAARRAIAPGGYYSPEAVTERIIDMADTLADGDPSRLPLLEDAIEEGFAEAELEYGDELPAVSLETHGLLQEQPVILTSRPDLHLVSR